MTTQTTINSKYLVKLTPDNSVLVMVDYLTGFMPGLKTIDEKTYYNNVTALAKIGKIFQLPTIILGDEGGFRGELFPQISEFLSHGQRIGRHTPSAWHEPAFVKALQQFNRPKIIMAGISLDNCVTQTALDVLRAGYEVYVVVDVSGTDSPLVEQAAIMRLTQAGAVMTNWVSLVETTLEEFDKVMALNVRGVFLALQQAARRIENGGRIVNLSSNVTIQPLANGSVYTASKAAVEQFTRVLAKLVSDDAHWVTGQSIRANGGIV